MIGFLRGVVITQDGGSIIVDVSGVGYKVLVSPKSKATSASSKVQLFIYTHVREDQLDLYGFDSREELKLFEMLLSVSGVGPKTALGIFGRATSREIAQAIVAQDVDFFSSVPRLGKKNAQKIIIELRSKLGASGEVVLSDEQDKETAQVVAALRSFGFSTQEITHALKSVQRDISAKEKIKMALRVLGR